MKGRQNESLRIRAANKAVAVVKLMDGKILDWMEFLEPDTEYLDSLPRRALKAGQHDVKRRVSKNIQKFCDTNFVNMTEIKLVELYEQVKKLHGLEIPLHEFQAKFARFRPRALASNPLHSTIRISLWGLGFEFPERHLADDVETALRGARKYDTKLGSYENRKHDELSSNRNDIARCIRHLKFHSRMTVLSCFNLVEAYFNGLAWEYIQDPNRESSLSKSSADLLKDTSGVSLRKKIVKYPLIISREAIFEEIAIQ